MFEVRLWEGVVSVESGSLERVACELGGTATTPFRDCPAQMISPAVTVLKFEDALAVETPVLERISSLTGTAGVPSVVVAEAMVSAMLPIWGLECCSLL